MTQPPSKSSAVGGAPKRPVSAPSLRRRRASDPDIRTSVVSFSSLRRRVVAQTWLIILLSGFLIGVAPFVGTVNIYYAMTPEQKVKRLISLSMPNMTNRAILAWATTSITEVMTMGFGDMDIRLPKQKVRFTSAGWDTYIKMFETMKMRERFKTSQLVLTTVPSNTPVVVSQGLNGDNQYQWVVQMPVVMTYATNNNVRVKSSGLVHLTIVRVPTEENSFGIAIKRWIVI